MIFHNKFYLFILKVFFFYNYVKVPLNDTIK